MTEDIHGEKESSPIEEVRLTVPTTDDKDLPVLTFRTWILGPISCAFLAFTNQLFVYQQNLIYVGDACVQLILLAAGKLMAAVLPTNPITILGTKLSLTLNPGPFNIKEHVLINLFASKGNEYPYAAMLIFEMKAFYHSELHPLTAFLLIHTTQLMGYGFAGLLIKFLVDSPYMWWPQCLGKVASYRALHEVEKRPKGGLSRYQYFFVVAVSSFAYYFIPGYIFQSTVAFSVICWFCKSSVTAQQIGAGLTGLGIGSFSLDWSSISFMGSPLIYPAHAILNMFAGFVILICIIVPIAYWTNAYEAKRFPIFSQHIFDDAGQKYNVSRIIDSTTFQFNQEAYDSYSKMFMSVVVAYSYGFRFAGVTALVVHVILYDGKSIWKQFVSVQKDGSTDIHTRLMRHYATIPQWWFYIITFSMVALAIFTVEGFKGELQLPYWGIFLFCAVTPLLVLPLGVISATSGARMDLSVILVMISGYLYHGKPIATIAFKSYGLSCMNLALAFLSDFKLGHYMKIPPRSMFLVQLFATVLSSTVSFTTSLWLLSTVKNICNPNKIPQGSPWTCPSQTTIYSSINMWGLLGPTHVFAPHGVYSHMYYFFLIGALATATTWTITRFASHKSWINHINIPLVFLGPTAIPAIQLVNYWTWFAVAIVFNVFIYHTYRGWWSKCNYLLSSGLDTGVAFMALLMSFLQLRGMYGISWWGQELSDHCPLAHCPTASGIKIAGCPVFH